MSAKAKTVLTGILLLDVVKTEAAPELAYCKTLGNTAQSLFLMALQRLQL